MPDIYTSKGRLLADTHALVCRKHPGNYFYVDTTYDWTASPRYGDSILRMSASFKSIIRGFANDRKSPCIVSKLLLYAMSYKVYCAKNHINYISFRESKGLISFMPFGKTQEVTDDGRWAKTGRQTMKPGKFARAILNPRLSKRLNDKHFALFATKFKAYEESTESVVERTTFEVAYKEESGWGYSTGSCMRNKPVQEFYSCFDCQPLIIKTGAGLIMGRAILWNQVELVNSAGKVVLTAPFLDRIYAPPEFSELFIDHAIQLNAIHRGYSGGVQLFYDNKKYDDTFYIRTRALETYTQHWIPYLDTFRFGSCDQSTIYSLNIPNDYKYSFDRTTGEFVDNGYEKGYVMTRYNNYRSPENCLIYNGDYYLKGGRDTLLCHEDNEYYMYNDRTIVLIDGLVYKKTSDKLGRCQYSDLYCLKDMLVDRWIDNILVRVHKKYAHYYSDRPKSKIDKVHTPYTFTFKPTDFNKSKDYCTSLDLVESFDF